MLESTDEIVVELRRYAFPRDGAPVCGRLEVRYPGAEAVVNQVHDVSVEVRRDTGTMEKDTDGDATLSTIALDDPRWPTHCSCGYEFQPSAAKQEFHTRLYRRSDNGELTTIRNAPVGALYDSGVFRDSPEYNRNGAGMCLVLKTPAGEWMIDGPANNGPGWTRTGTPPNLVVRPSIGIGSPQRMHGWLGGEQGKGDEPGWLCIDSP